METTRRLSLTLLLVAPLIAAQDSRTEDLSLSSVSGEHLPDGVRPQKPREEQYDDQEEIGTTTTMGGVEGKLGRERRDESAEDMEVAEQVVFKPYFRNSQILADRKQSKGAGLDSPTASGQAYYHSQYNYYYPF